MSEETAETTEDERDEIDRESIPLVTTDPAKKRGRPSLKDKPKEEQAWQKAMRGRKESDIFAGPKTGTKYVVSRNDPVKSEVTGARIDGYQDTHNPPFDLNKLRETYGGGIYVVQRFENGEKTNESEVRIPGFPKERVPQSVATQAAPSTQGGGVAPITISDLIALAREMRPEPAPAPPPPPTVKDQLETLVLFHEAADRLGGGREKSSGGGLLGIVQSIPEQAWVNATQGILDLCRGVASKLTGASNGVSKPDMMLPNGTKARALPPFEELARLLHSRITAGLESGQPTPEMLAQEIASYPGAGLLRTLYGSKTNDEVFGMIDARLSEKGRAFTSRSDVRDFMARTLDALRGERNEKSNAADVR